MNNLNQNNDDNFDKKLEQISKIISRISVIACLLIGILFSLFLMIAYGVPLSGFERDMKKSGIRNSPLIPKYTASFYTIWVIYHNLSILYFH